MTPAGELRALGAFYGLSVEAIEAAAGALGPALDRYAEWVLDRDGFAVVTLGDAETIASFGTEKAGVRLRAAAARWPEAATGVKLDLAGRHPPTLYVRPTCPWEEGVALFPELGAAPPARTLYGLGFQGDLLKTYALTPEGFVSWRVGARAPGIGGDRRISDNRSLDHKRYQADLRWEALRWPDARWEAIGALGRRLGFQTAGHLGIASTGAWKVYVERTGGIPTDRSFA